jgi:hypothetical protein
MKLFKRPFIAVFITSLTLILNSIITPNSASAGELDVLGFKVTWSDPFYIAAYGTCGRYSFNYKNNLGGRIINVRIDLSNKYGSILSSDFISGGVKDGISGAWALQICGTQFEAVVGPYEAKVTLQDYSGNTREGKTSVIFLPIPTATPKPTPTVTAQATPSPASTVYITNPADATLQDLVISLKSQISLLEKKLKKVCAAKPKPKGC